MSQQKQGLLLPPRGMPPRGMPSRGMTVGGDHPQVSDGDFEGADRTPFDLFSGVAAHNALLNRPAPVVAPALLGWRLSVNGITGMIAETEAYHGEDDLACHASKGRTARTATLYAAPGTLYVYLCYGMHHLLNLVTDEAGVPSAVLIRGLVIHGIDPKRSNGPGKVAKLLGLNLSHNGQEIGTEVQLLPPIISHRVSSQRVIPQRVIPQRVIRCGPRVGVNYAGPLWSQMPWRWWLADFPVVVPAIPR